MARSAGSDKVMVIDYHACNDGSQVLNCSHLLHCYSMGKHRTGKGRTSGRLCMADNHLGR